MRIFKNTWFCRFASKEGLDDTTLRRIIKQIESGNFDSNLGGGIFKQNIAREGKGKSGGYRTIICSQKDTRSFFVYGFSKSNRQNITQGELTEFKKLAITLFSMSEEQLNSQIQAGVFKEITNEE